MPDLTPEAADSLATAARWRDGSTEYVLLEAARAICHEIAALREALDPVPADLAERAKATLDHLALPTKEGDR